MKRLSTIVVAGLSIGVLHAVQPAQRSVTVGAGITVSVREAGTGLPVGALHGGPGFRDYLPLDLEPPTSSFRLISCDQRGSGSSTVVTDPALRVSGPPVYRTDACSSSSRVATSRSSSARRRFSPRRRRS